MTEARKYELLQYLVEGLCAERPEEAAAIVAAMDGAAVGPDVRTDALWTAFRALVNTRQPLPAPQEWLNAQDELLQGMIADAGICTLADAAPAAIDGRLHVWRGDITTLAVDAIVNAANSQMLGCWVPGHYCIDNAIHTFAGVQLRFECARIMALQGSEEPTGQAKITPAYNLPAAHVIHTVGPIARGCPTDVHRAQLASSYTSCLDLSAASGLHSIAFCCISTGVFGFPQQEAAEIAVETVCAWLGEHGFTSAGDGVGSADLTTPTIQVIFNVFGEADEQIYRTLLG